MKSFKVVKKGFYDGNLLQPGDVFEAEEFSGSWAVPVEEYKPEPEKTPQVLAEEAVEGLQGKKKAKKRPAKKKTAKKKSSK